MAVVAIAEYDTYRRELDRFLSERRESAAMLNRLWQSLERFEALGIPSRQHEAWRFTDVSGLANRRFARAGEVPVDAGLLPALDAPHYRLTFVNGRFAAGLSRLPSNAEKAVIASLNQALSSHPELVETTLASVPGLEDHPFAALNGAFWEDGAFIHLPRGLVLEHPLHLVFYATGPETRNYPRNVVMLESGAQAVIVEEHRGSGDYLSCPFTEVHTAEGAVLDYYKVQQEDGWHLGALALRQKRDSRIHGHMLSLGGPLSRTDVAALLQGAGAECFLDGLTLVTDGELGDQHIRMEHATPHGVSRQVFKGVLAGKSKTVFDGMVHVPRNAQKNGSHAEQPQPVAVPPGSGQLQPAPGNPG
jgi:Fe-S cluster assembly protein SufD